MDFQILNKALSAEKTTDMGDPADLGQNCVSAVVTG